MIGKVLAVLIVFVTWLIGMLVLLGDYFIHHDQNKQKRAG